MGNHLPFEGCVEVMRKKKIGGGPNERPVLRETATSDSPAIAASEVMDRLTQRLKSSTKISLRQ